MAKKNEINIIPLYANPLLQIQLDLDTDKLTELAVQIQNKDKKGRADIINRGGWQSNNITEESHEEFKKLKKEITQYLQLYHSKVFRGMKFKGNVTQSIDNMWVMINEKHHYVDWHIHLNATLSGVYYIKHDGVENGDILFKHPEYPQMSALHWKKELVEVWNMTSGEILNITPSSNMLLIFPSWTEHKVEFNLKNDSRISVSFNSLLIPEIK
jgi:uncharacterized protein (TIGR02466 family)